MNCGIHLDMNSYSTNENFFEDYSIMIEDPVQFAEVYSFVQDFVVSQASTPPPLLWTRTSQCWNTTSSTPNEHMFLVI